ncbi:MaoC like domain-containing protein [Haloechinothrix alba]|uniref:MaoC like domain-containing protein n=1 Tax=Haloechinothrix alba TaxID=664784 RepID=A0A238V109_9PSEU|nr:MaoC/PaaZ C-terminal domain-containing protein [Haloechinothrix alba]SNR27199.1 MaoC like domain-containing protein [Haloechinothrix alba]
MAVTELDSAPNLAALYPKALVSGLLPGGRRAAELPDEELVRSGVQVDPDHLAAYNEVCGFRLSDELPATYPHVLAFPLQVKLMAEPSFPFPLPGLVHVANTITQRRPLLVTERFSVRVRVSDLRPHEKGRQFDVISEAVVEGQDEPVWTDISTYLRRGGGSGSGGKREQLSAPTPTAVWQVPGDIGRRYAEVSGDHNPIHLYAATAKLFGFPKAIAHGMWTKAHALSAFEGKLPAAYTVSVGFKQPVLLPGKAAFTTWTTEGGYAFELWNARKPKPHMDGTISTLA